MAEFCKQCFIKTWQPNAYDVEHIVMSDDNTFCEGCMAYLPYVDHIDDGDTILTPRLKDFILGVTHQRKIGNKLACVECGAIFEDDDFAYTHETGLCQYCHRAVNVLWVKYKW